MAYKADNLFFRRTDHFQSGWVNIQDDARFCIHDHDAGLYRLQNGLEALFGLAGPGRLGCLRGCIGLSQVAVIPRDHRQPSR